jgi:hypothetical protein
MTITGFFRAEDHAPYVTATVVQDDLRLNRDIRFLVDSGASATVIADTDARRLGIDYHTLQHVPDGMIGIGGTVETFVLPSVRLVFITDGGAYEEELERIYVLRHHITDARMRARIERIPSLLGRDVLNKYTVLLRHSDDVVVITDDDIMLS